VTAGGVNLFRSRQEIKQSNDAWFYTVFQLEGSAELSRMTVARCSEPVISR
jgi:AraC family transcriptional activator of tynA and feaB